MGNNLSSSSFTNNNNSNNEQLAIVAVARKMSLTQEQVIELRTNCRMGSLGQKRTRPKVSRASFQKALMRACIVEEDAHVFHQLFILWSQDDGEERVDFVEFLSGTSILACHECKSLRHVFLFALEVMDLHGTKHVSRTQLETLLNGINATASYFGDFVLSKQQIGELVESTFASLEPNSKGEVSHDKISQYLPQHDLIHQFVLGKGHCKYIPNRHDIVKVVSTEEEEEEGSLIVGAVRDIHGNITSTEIGNSNSSDQHNEI